MMKATLYDRTTIATLQWPDEPWCRRVKEYLHLLVNDGIRAYVDNVDADFYLIHVDTIILPIVVVNDNYTNSYVCSPYGHYITQALNTDHLVPNKWLQQLSKGFSKGLGTLSRKAKINSAVFVNHWLSATDTYPANLTEKHIRAIIALLKERFPQHAILFRSLNLHTNASLIQQLQETDCHLIASRQVFLNDTKKDTAFRKRDTKRDIKLLREGPYKIVDALHLAEDQLTRICELYSELYISHHTTLNPQFNLSFFKVLYRSGFMKLKLIVEEEQILGMAGCYEQDGVLVSPIFGFDKSHPKSGELYQLLCLALLLEAKERNLVWNQSSGASTHKKNRGAEPFLETMAVYADHLPMGRRLFWHGFKRVINTFAVPFMKKY